MGNLFSKLTAGAFVCCFFGIVTLGKASTDKSETKLSAAEEVEPAPVPKTEPSQGAVASTKGNQDQDSRKSKAAPNATLLPAQIVEYRGELPRVKKLIESALALTTQGLTYTGNSDNPDRGGMDCSGFTSYVLAENGFVNVPRDASGQYVWLRKAGTFRAVLSQNPETFELDDLRPGDLLFWTGTYSTDHDPPVTHVMIYLGTEKGTKNRVMVGSTDGRFYHGQSRWGVSVYDFHSNPPLPASAGRLNQSIFVGYARLPGLRD